MILPRREMKRWTRFIVEEEGWYMVEYDHSSVPGIMYVSLCEEKVNSLTDDLVNDIADTDSIAVYSISAPAETQVFGLGATVNPIYTITKNGKPVEMEVVVTSKNKQVVSSDMLAKAEGEAELEIKLKDYPQIVLSMTVQVASSGAEQLFYIKGSSSIKLNRTETYTFESNDETNADISFSIDNDTLAAIVTTEGNSCSIKANGKNKTGTIVLTAIYGGKNYTKEIKIVPLW